VVTNDRALAERMRTLRDHGMDPSRPYWHPVVGYNFRLTNLQAAVGLAQHEQIDTFLQAKRQIAARYRAGLAEVPGLACQPTADWATHSSWLFAILVKPEFGRSRDHLQNALRDRGIDTRRAAYEIHTMPPYQTGERRRYPVAAQLSAEGLHLPSGSGLSVSDQMYVIDSIRELAGLRPWPGMPSSVDGNSEAVNGAVPS
jgi:perosamine synthetase